MIKINNITKKFNQGRSNEVVAVNNVSIEFPKTGIVTLFGHSGSGKTTILNIVGGLDKPTNGNVEIDNQVIRNFDNIRSLQIGYVFQNYNLFTNLSVFDNVAFVLKMIGINDQDYIKERVEHTLDLVNMLPFMRKKAGELSGGQQQRVAIARALVKNPDFIIADEPTGNIDSKNKLEIMNILRKIAEHKLVILVTHEENIANFYSDRIISLRDGLIISDKENTPGVDGDFIIDNKIYLDQLEVHESIKTDNLELSYFGDKKNDLKVKLIFQDGTLYIESNDETRVDLINENTRVKILDKKEDEGNDSKYDTDFEYESIEIDQSKLSKRKLFDLKTTIKVAFSKLFNRSLRGKLLIFALMLSGLLIAIGAIRLGRIFLHSIDESSMFDKDVYKMDRNYEKRKEPITVSTGDDIYYFSTHYNNPLMTIESLGNTDAIYRFHPRLLPSEELVSGDLLHGSLPILDNEMAISKALADEIIADKEKLGVWDIKYLVGREVIISNHQAMKISAVVKGTSKSVYMKYNTAGALSIIEHFDYKPHFPVELINPNIEEGRLPIQSQTNEYEVVISYDMWKRIKDVDTFEPFTLTRLVNGQDFDKFLIFGVHEEYEYQIKVVGVFENIYKGKPYDDTVYMRAADLSTLNKKLQSDSTLIYFYSRNKVVVNELSEKYNVVNAYQSRIAEDRRLRRIDLSGTLTFSGVLFVLSAIGFYFINKSEMLRHMYQINVYRSLGVRKWEIIKTFIIDIIVLTTVSSLIGYLIATGVYIRISGGIFGELGLFRFHWPTIIAGVGLVYFINILAGIIPILVLLRKTPANIMRTYDF